MDASAPLTEPDPAAAATPGTVPALFFRRVAELGDQTALRQKVLGLWRDISWTDYGENVRAAACGLIALGVAPGDCVAIIGENIPEWLYADLGCQAAGGVAVGIYTTNSAEECAYILGHSESRVFVVENEEQLDKALETRAGLPRLEKIVVVDTEGLRHFSDPMVMSWADFLELGRAHDRDRPDDFADRLSGLGPDGTAALIYTSGTTGPPKGAMLSHANIVWTSDCLVRFFGASRADEVISFLPLSHIAERMLSVYNAIAAGYRVNFVESPDTVTQNMTEVSPSFMFSVPRIWEKYQSAIVLRMRDATPFKRLVFAVALRIGKAHAAAKLDGARPVPLWLRALFAFAHFAVFAKLKKRLGFDRLHTPVSGAAAISPNVLRFYHAIGLPLRQLYGQTEDCGPTSCHRPDHIDPTDTGPPVPGIEVRIAEDGEILVRGPNVFQGYFKNPDATAEALAGGWLHTGDVGEMTADGRLRITDRKKDLIITAGGKNIAPQNIENQLKFSPYVTDAIVIGDGRKYVIALIVMDEENVIKFAQDHKVHYTTYASLAAASEIEKLFRDEIAKVNATLARVEQVKRFAVLPKKLMEEEGDVTPTMKVKRKNVNATFAELIEGVYAETAGVRV